MKDKRFAIEFRDISKKFGNVDVINRFNLSINQGEFIVFLGPSGCGKSTLLRILLGLEAPNSGTIVINGKDVTNKAPSKRDLSMVFQSYALFPHLTVKENILFGLKIRGVKKTEQEEKLKKVVELVDLNGLLDRKPSELSGGQKQRVALARAFVSEHKICLMDEPLSNLDAKLRQEVRREIRAIHDKLKLTTVYVTHDQSEAMSMADRVVLLQYGSISQIGTPLELYDNVKNMFVANFLGMPPMNIIDLDGSSIFQKYQKVGAKYIGIRPEKIEIDKDTEVNITGKVLFKNYQGGDTVIGISIHNAKHRKPFLIKVKSFSVLEENGEVHAGWHIADMHLFDDKENSIELTQGEKNEI